jgi:hypothetical protein
MSDATTYLGGCFCGAVRYRAAGVPAPVCYCHCTSCRRAVGAMPVAWATFRYSAFEVTQGRLCEAATSPGVARGHCVVCGSSLTYRNTLRPDEIDITVATLDEPLRVQPTAHIWVQDKLPWVHIDDGLPQYATVTIES